MATNIRKKTIHPIILSQLLFTDCFGKVNSYVEMNPSMYIDDIGNVKILVRLVNYRKFHNKTFTMNENFSKSVYVLMTGVINTYTDLNLDTFESQMIQVNYNIPTYNTFWIGLEDIRFIDKDTILAIVPECNLLGNPSIFKASLEENIIHSFIDCKPNQVEKNWMPFMNMNTKKVIVIYSVCPFKLKNIETDEFTDICLSEKQSQELHGYNGSTNGILFLNTNSFLFLIHINKEKSYHKWILYNDTTNEIKTSNCFTFFQHSYIEFPISLCQYNETIFVSLGINDDKAFIIEIEPLVIEDLFT